MSSQGLEEQYARQSGNLLRDAGRFLPLLEQPTKLDFVVNADGFIWLNRPAEGGKCEGDYLSEISQLLLSGFTTIHQLQLDAQHPLLRTISPLPGNGIEGSISPMVMSSGIAIGTHQKELYPFGEVTVSRIPNDKNDPLSTKRHRDNFLQQLQGHSRLDVIRLACHFRRILLRVRAAGSGRRVLLKRPSRNGLK